MTTLSEPAAPAASDTGTPHGALPVTAPDQIFHDPHAGLPPSASIPEEMGSEVSTRQFAANKLAILDVLRSVGVTRADVIFDGVGDKALVGCFELQ